VGISGSLHEIARFTTIWQRVVAFGVISCFMSKKGHCFVSGKDFDDKDAGAELYKFVFQKHPGRMPSRSSKAIEYHGFTPQCFIGDSLA
jgi:hypothetical protein